MYILQFSTIVMTVMIMAFSFIVTFNIIFVKILNLKMWHWDRNILLNNQEIRTLPLFLPPFYLPSFPPRNSPHPWWSPGVSCPESPGGGGWGVLRWRRGLRIWWEGGGSTGHWWDSSVTHPLSVMDSNIKVMSDLLCAIVFTVLSI